MVWEWLLITASGLSDLPFVIIYCLSCEEIPGSDGISIPVKGLAVGEHQDLYSGDVGYVTFSCGNGKTTINKLMSS